MPEIDSSNSAAVSTLYEPNRSPSKITKFAFTCIRVIVTFGLLGILFMRLDGERMMEIFSQISFLLFSQAVVTLCLASVFNTWRWQIILAVSGTASKYLTLLKIWLIGLFFSQLLPTAIGGDAVRAWCCRQIGMAWGAAIRSILLDRASGYLVVVLLYTIGLHTLVHFIPDAGGQLTLIILLALAIAGLISSLLIDQVPSRLLRLRFVAQLAILSVDARRILKNRRLAFAIVVQSAVGIGLTVWSVKLIGDSLGFRLSFGTWAAIIPPVTLIQIIPISMAGWGIRELSLVYILAAFGLSKEAALAISVLIGFCQLLVALPGGLVWLTWSIRLPKQPKNG